MSLSVENQRPSVLSNRERMIAELVGKGLRNREIANALQLTEGTVKLHVHHILQKLNLSSRRRLLASDYPGTECGTAVLQVAAKGSDCASP